jgi:PKD repeat protein
VSGTYTVTLTVTDSVGVTGTLSQSVEANLRPIASFTFACTGSACAFDGSPSSDPDGSIASYTWYFGDDGASGVGATVNHTYTAVGTFTVMLYVRDDVGAVDLQQQTVTITVTNAPPVASFTSACTWLTCTFNGAGSSDPDGHIASHAWNFGDGMTGSGASVSHTYLTGGTYSVTLTVTDNAGATSTYAQTVTAVPPPPPPLPIHVGDVDGASTTQQNLWTATVTITVHNSVHAAVAGATVTGVWSDSVGGSCTTNAGGQCAVIRSGIPRKTTSVGFSITNVTRATLVYQPTDNHDPEGDSNGSVITVIRR